MTTAGKPSDGTNDRYLWLEEIHDARAADWVAAENARTAGALVDAQFDADRVAVLAMLERDDRLPIVSRRGHYLYNTWTDARNPRGLWRRTTLESYRSSAPAWDTVLDIDALGASEGKAWKFAGATALPPDYKRALVKLSPGGSDATEVREFDLDTKRFVDGGFFLPLAKCWAVWIDADTILFGHAAGAEHTTTSGYSRTIRKLKRGQALADAATVFECGAGDMAAWGGCDLRGGKPHLFFVQQTDFFHKKLFVEPIGGTRQLLAVPDDADASFNVAGDVLAIRPRSEWAADGGAVPPGALAVTRLSRFLSGERELQILFRPTARRALASYAITDSHIILTINDTVTSQLEIASRDAAARWTLAPVTGLPALSTIGAIALDADNPVAVHDLLLTTQSFTSPVTTLLWTPPAAPAVLKTAPSLFDATRIETRQHMAKAVDGVDIPYFVVGQRSSLESGPCPTVMRGYGGFEVSELPVYAPNAGKLWIEHGCHYVVANIRGGGEFGPHWHEAGRRAKKAVSHDDFAAVARDLVVRGYTTARQLGCWGGSNGGLLVGNMLTRYPELFGAIVCQVPLLDMARYTKLLAGASWIAEYGDPDDPAEWPFIQRFSPYHTIARGPTYPAVLLTTSRNDDRVHPGHARKMAARMAELGIERLFYENVEGGHGGAADPRQAAYLTALSYAFLRRMLRSQPSS